MPKNVGRVEFDVVTSGAPIIGPGVPTVLVNGKPICVLFDEVMPHGKYPHNASLMVSGSPNVFAGPANMPVCGTGDQALCGETLLSSSNVFVN